MREGNIERDIESLIDRFNHSVKKSFKRVSPVCCNDLKTFNAKVEFSDQKLKGSKKIKYFLYLLVEKKWIVAKKKKFGTFNRVKIVRLLKVSLVSLLDEKKN